MAKSNKLSPLAATVSAAFIATAMGTSAQAAENPFATTELNQGYQLADKHKEGKCGEGKCGEGKDKDAKKGEGKCGEGKCGEGKKDRDGKKGEGKCGEGKCGG
jgi:uncharacterized low-complexity protein